MSKVLLETSLGNITLELNPEKAPIGSENFLNYVQEGFYDGTIFHRIIPGFMVQGGGMTSGLQEKPGGEAIANEADNGLKNTRGALSYARTMDPHSASSQFFINLKDNAFLDHSSKDTQGWGYAVFGEVISGMDVVDAMAQVETTTHPTGHQDVPKEDVTLLKARVVTD